MKKILSFIFVLLLSAGIAKAQDIYFAGHSAPDTLGNSSASVWKNNVLVYNWFDTIALPTVNDMFVAENGDVYCAGYTTDTLNAFTGTVWKNGEVFLTATEGSVFNKMIVNDNNIITAGYIADTNEYTHAAIWQNGELLYTPSDTITYSAINAIAMDDEGNIYSAGIVPYPSASLIWKNDEVFLELSSIATIDGMIFSDGNIYAAGHLNANGFRIAAMWQNDSIIYQDESGSVFSEIHSICKSGDDVFAAGNVDTTLVVLQNGEVLYEIPFSGFPIEGYSRIHHLCISETNLYFTGCLNGEGMVWKDGEILYQPENCSDIIGLAVFPVCDGETRTLPWTDGFEAETTDWTCWNILDFDGNSVINWERNTDQAHSGDFSARHLACDNIQEGWLIAPPIYLQPNRDSTWMSFNTMEINAESYTYSGVWISTTGTETNNFAEIWTQENPSENWDTISIDLSGYQGEVVYMAFKYSGHHGHNWYIDDVTLNETYAMRDTIYEFPFINDFEEGLDDWFVIDEDHSGKQHNWKLVEQGLESGFCLGHDHDTIETYQKSWAISRPLHFDDDMFYTFRYANIINGLSDRDLSGIYLADNIDHAPTPADFTLIQQNDSNLPDWEEREINLNEYAGHDIYLAFGYEGYDHDWLIDNVVLESRIAEYTIDAIPDNPERGEVVGGGTYHVHDTIQIEAIPYEGFVFNQWEDACLDNPRTVVVTENQSYTAQFGIQQCQIMTEVTPEGAGTVEGSGIYDYGTTIHLMAMTHIGHQFAQWSDGISENPRTVVVKGDATYVAVFSTNQYTVTAMASPEEGGRVEGAGTYFYGERIELKATPNENYIFLCWSDGITSNPREVMVNDDMSFTALFFMNGTPEHVVSVYSNNPLIGGVTGSGTYPEGTVVRISAFANDQARFTHWDDGNTDNPRFLEVTEDITLTAYFELIPTYTITVESENPLLGNVYGSGTYMEGSIVEIGALPGENFYFSGWQDGDMNNPRNILVTEDATYTASFAAEPTPTYDIAIYYDENQGFVLGAGTYVAGSIATIAAIPADGYQFVKWGDGITENPREIIVDHDIILAAFFNGTGVEECQANALSVFPNPTNGKIRVPGIEDATEVEIYNAFGALLRKIHAEADTEIDVSDLASGFYFVRIGKHFGKFVKQ